MSIGRLEAMRIYQDYHCNGNTMHTSIEDMTYIVITYKNDIPNWQKKFNELDETVYDFDDDEFVEFAKKGKEDAKNTTGYKNNFGDKAAQYGRTAADIVTSGTAAAGAFVANGGLGINALGLNLKVGEKAAETAVQKLGEKVLEKGGEKLAEKVTEKAAEKLVKETLKKGGEKVTKEVVKQGAKEVLTKETAVIAGKEVTKKAAKQTGTQMAGQSISCIAGCVMGAATAALYYAKRPNKDQVDAANQVNQIHQENQTNLVSTQADMQNMSEELAAAAQEAEDVNQEANNKIIEEKVKYDRFSNTRNSIKNKANSGKQLSESEKSLYRTVSSQMADTGDKINTTVDNTSNTVEGISPFMPNIPRRF